MGMIIFGDFRDNPMQAKKEKDKVSWSNDELLQMKNHHLQEILQFR